MTRLPRSVDELRGRRAARWVRESTRGQFVGSERLPIDTVRASVQDVHMNNTGPTLETVKAQRDAHGAYCATCDQYFMVDTSPYWHWSKSMWMHRSGTGHKVTMFRFAAVETFELAAAA